MLKTVLLLNIFVEILLTPNFWMVLYQIKAIGPKNASRRA